MRRGDLKPGRIAFSRSGIFLLPVLQTPLKIPVSQDPSRLFLAESVFLCVNRHILPKNITGHILLFTKRRHIGYILFRLLTDTMMDVNRPQFKSDLFPQSQKQIKQADRIRTAGQPQKNPVISPDQLFLFNKFLNLFLDTHSLTL